MLQKAALQHGCNGFNILQQFFVAD